MASVTSTMIYVIRNSSPHAIKVSITFGVAFTGYIQRLMLQTRRLPNWRPWQTADYQEDYALIS